MKALLDQCCPELLDPLARHLAEQVQWLQLPGLGTTEPFPVAVLGSGAPVLLLHGFDSSFLEFRRLAPLLDQQLRLIIPDLFGFGFSPRPEAASYGPESVMRHLDVLLDHGPFADQPITDQSIADQSITVIGASMGGAVAVELARRHPERIGSLLLLAPAGLTGRPMPVPPLLDRLGAWFLSRPGVRRGLCRQAFADPDACVGPPEEQIASLHLRCPNWGIALAAFARSGGFAGCGHPLPSQPLHVIWGAEDRILRPKLKADVLDLLQRPVETFEACGHLPHLDHPGRVAERCLAITSGKQAEY